MKTDRPLVLASASTARRALLKSAGLDFAVAPAAIDEAVIRRHGEDRGSTPPQIALSLAEAKARAVMLDWPDAVVLGADQVAVLGGTILTKAENRDAAAASLAALRGRSHRLISAVVLVVDNAVTWRYAETAIMTMRPFSDVALSAYLATAGDALTGCVGGYQIEGPGIQLFERIEGHQSTIMGLPMLPLLSALRRFGVIAQ